AETDLTVSAPPIPAVAAAKPDSSPPVPALRRVPGWGIAECFVISQTALPACLMLPGAQRFRLEVRISAYLVALLPLIFVVLRKRERHPAVPYLFAFLGYVALMIVHPQTN